MSAQKRPSRGFSIFELLIVMAILALLFITGTLVASAQMKKARDGKRKSDLTKIKTALYDYYFDKDCFPAALPACGQDLKSNQTVYLHNFPCDSKGNPYIYETDRTHCQWFKVLTNLENTRDGDIDRVGCRTGCGPSCQYNYGLASTKITVYDDCIQYYACNPGGQCQAYDNPSESGCPTTYKNDPTCANSCPQTTKEERCENASGKNEPGSNEPNNPDNRPIEPEPTQEPGGKSKK